MDLCGREAEEGNKVQAPFGEPKGAVGLDRIPRLGLLGHGRLRLDHLKEFMVARTPTGLLGAALSRDGVPVLLQEFKGEVWTRQCPVLLEVFDGQIGSIWARNSKLLRVRICKVVCKVTSMWCHAFIKPVEDGMDIIIDALLQRDNSGNALRPVGMLAKV